jgi:hypothetical protein
MDNLFMLLLLASLVLLVIGLFNPKTSLFWDKKVRTKKKSALIYGGLTILFFILFGATTDTKKRSISSDTTQTAATSEPSTPQLTQAQTDSIAKVEKENELAEIKKNTISAPDLTAAYEANEVNADNNFKGKTFYVSGTVTDIKKDIMDDIYVILQGSEMLRDVQCYFDDKETAAQLHKGMKVTFKGTCDGLMMNVQMKNCVLVDNSK